MDWSYFAFAELLFFFFFLLFFAWQWRSLKRDKALLRAERERVLKQERALEREREHEREQEHRSP
ncbi:MAG: hypothetical protein ACKO3C_13955 [Betaproteobacteria bacterium]|nr:hypothetical protein [Betaproteobacteria bacterium]